MLKTVMKQSGFTVIELTVVAVIMAILITLAVVNVRSTQTNARDTERHADTKNIATALESFYTSTHDGTWTNTYPGYSDMVRTGTIGTFLKTKTGDGSLQAPGLNVDYEWSVVVSTNTVQTTTGVLPSPTISTYVYQPLTANNTRCSTYQNGCTKFNIFYKLENPTDECPAPQNICMIRSVRQ